eukprot:16449203-Heterocapsa_arctica.AAC.1
MSFLTGRWLALALRRPSRLGPAPPRRLGPSVSLDPGRALVRRAGDGKSLHVPCNVNDAGVPERYSLYSPVPSR